MLARARAEGSLCGSQQGFRGVSGGGGGEGCQCPVPQPGTLPHWSSGPSGWSRSLLVLDASRLQTESNKAWISLAPTLQPLTPQPRDPTTPNPQSPTPTHFTFSMRGGEGGGLEILNRAQHHCHYCTIFEPSGCLEKQTGMYKIEVAHC